MSQQGWGGGHPPLGGLPLLLLMCPHIGRGSSPEHVGQEGLGSAYCPGVTVFTQHAMVPVLPVGSGICSLRGFIS